MVEHCCHPKRDGFQKMHDIHNWYDPRDGVGDHRALNHITNIFNLPCFIHNKWGTYTTGDGNEKYNNKTS